MNVSLADLIEHMRDQHAMVELTSYCDDPHFVAPIFRTRVLSADESGLVLQRPLQAEAAGCFHPRSLVSIIVVDSLGNRWELIASVRRSMRVKLNALTDVPALMLSYPHELRSGQRRSFYRAATGHAQPESILLAPLLSAEQEKWPVEQQHKSFNAALLNISGGGVGVLAPVCMRDQLAQTRDYTCRMILPVLGFPMHIPVRIVHREVMDDGQTYLGMAFDFDEERGDRQRIVDEVCRYTTRLQRLQLRKHSARR